LVRAGETPERVVAAVLNAVLKERYPLLARLPSSKTLGLHVSVTNFVRWLAPMDVSEVGFWVSSAYAQLVLPEIRQDRAMFFTPPLMGERLLDQMERAGVDWGTARVIDIACGGAAFLAPAGVRMAKCVAATGATAKQVLAHVETHLHGIEIEPFLAKLSATFVGMALYAWIAVARRLPRLRITVGDAMGRPAILSERFDAVICNPPYRKLTSKQTAQLPAKFRQLCYFQPNLYAMFMARSLDLLSLTGVAGLLTPMSFLSGQSFVRLRQHLASQRRVASIDIVEQRLGVFLGVQQDTAISTFAPLLKRSAQTTVFAASGDQRWHAAGKVVLPATGAPWVLPRNADDATLIAHSNGRRISDYGYEPCIGDVVPLRETRALYASLAEAKAAGVKYAVPMLRAAEIRPDGSLAFPLAGRSDCFLDAGASAQGVIRAPCVALHRVSSTDQPRRFVAAPVPAELQRKHDGVIGENHVIFLTATRPDALAPDLLVRILGSEPVDRMFRCRSGSANVSTYELSHMPMPNATVVEQALTIGADIDTAVRRGYGIDTAKGGAAR